MNTRLNRLAIASTLALVATLAPIGHATPGDRDATFGTDGIVTTPFVPASFCGATGVVLQSDGKIVLGGYASNGSNYDFALVRYLANGTLDTSFDSDGKVTTSFGSGDDLATCAALQSDGKIVLAGYSFNGSNNDVALVRYLPNGSLDTSFGGTGKVITAIGAGNDRANDVAVQSDGKIVVAGYTSNGVNQDIALVRYNTDGSLDTSFGAGGKVTTATGSSNDTANSMVIQPDGKIVVAARITGQFGVVRYLSNGALDSAFDTDGQVITVFALGALASATEVALQSDGKIVVSGWGWNGSIESESFHAMARYNSDGSLDPGFSGDGMAVPGVFSSSSALAIQSDGKILVGDGGNVGGGGQSLGGDPVRLARFNANGTVDGSFAGGVIATSLPGPDDSTLWCNDIAIQPDGRIVAAGGSVTSVFEFIDDEPTFTDYFAFLALRYESAPEAGPDIRVEQPADTTLSDGSSTINFGIINTTSSQTRTFTIRNDGLSDLTGLSISVNGTNAAAFVPGAVGSTTLAANASTTFDVTFTPGTTGSKTATLHIASNDPNENPFDITLTGTGSIPDIVVQKWPNVALTDGSSTVDFGTVGLTLDSLVRFQISNSGSAQLDNISANVDGPNAAEFVIVSAPVNATISDTSRLQVLVSFRPSLAGSRTATLHITSNDPDEGSFDIALTGMGRALTAWDRDPGFGAFGRVVTPLVDPFPTYRAGSVELQADGKFIVLASPGVYVPSGGPTPESRFHLLRYLPGGALDATFGSAGLVTTDVGPGSDSAQDAVLQTDGKIVVAGSSGGKFALTRYTTAGALDSSFDGDGIVTTTIGTGCTGRSVLIQPDGKLIAAGQATVSGNVDFALARYLPDGSLDGTFGTAGIVTIPVGTDTDEATAAILQTDGKIVIAGHSKVGSYFDFALVRCNADGTLDSGFGSGGKIIVSMGTRNDFCSSCALYPDGRIAIGGISYDASFNTTWQIARFTAAGVLDNNFDGDGKLGLSPAGGGGGCNSLKVQADGKLLAAGRSDLDPAPFISNYDFVTLRLLDNGGLDASFGSSGIISTDFAYDDEAFSLWHQPDGQLLVAGSSNGGLAFARYAETPGSPEIVIEQPVGTGLTDGVSGIGFGSVNVGSSSGAFTFTVTNTGTADLTGLAIAKDGANSGDFTVGALGATTLVPNASTTFTVTFSPSATGSRHAAIHCASNDADETPFDIALVGTGLPPPGSIDPTFGTNGITVTPFGGSAHRGVGMAVQSDNKIVVMGAANIGGTDRAVIARYQPNGTLDASFGVAGKVETPMEHGHFWTGLALDPSGRIVTCGLYQSGVNYDFAVVRYNPDGNPDSTFDGDGQAFTSIGGSNDFAADVVIQRDGKIIVTGYSSNGSNMDFAAVRYNVDGSLDSGFDVDGKVTIPVIATNRDLGLTTSLQQDGKLVIAGFSNTGTDNTDEKLVVIRINPDGSLDSTFGSGGKLETTIGVRAMAYGVSIQSDGRIVVVGLVFNGSNNDFAIARYNVNGALDFTFGTGGIVTTPLGSSGDVAFGVALQSDGKILVTGRVSTFTPTTSTDFALVRYNLDGSLDATFGSGGQVITSIGSFNDYGREVVFLNDGRILVAGTTSNGTTIDIALARYESGLGPWPEIQVEQPVSTLLTDSQSAVNYGVVAANDSAVKTFTIRNTGSADLTGLAVTKDGANSGEYSVGTPGATTLVPGASTTFTVTFTPGASGLRTAAIHIASNDGDENTFDIALDGIGLTQQEHWRQTYFGTISNTGDAADTFDFDHDGLANLMEFVLGTNPTTNSSPGIALANNAGTLEFTYSRSSAAVGGLYINVVWSDTLNESSWTNSGVTQTILSDNGTTQQVKATVPAGGGGRRFLRVHVANSVPTYPPADPGG